MRKKFSHILLIIILYITSQPMLLLGIGKKITISEIRISCDNPEEKKFIESFLTLQEGDIVDSVKAVQKMESVKESLMNTFYYSSVHIYLLNKDNQSTDKVLLVDVRENPFPYLIGGGDIYASVSLLNWKNKGMDLSFILGYNKNELRWRKRHLAHGKWDFSMIIAYHNTRDLEVNMSINGIPKLSYEKKTVVFNLYRNITPRMSWGITSGYFHFQPYHVQQTMGILENRSAGYFSLGVQVESEYRDHIFYPKKGHYFYGEYVRRIEVSNHHFYDKFLLDGRIYMNILPTTSIMMRVFGGYISDQAPYSDLFMLNDIRKFRYSNSALYHGYKFTIGTVEIRKKVFRFPMLLNSWIEIAGFLDGGDVTNRSKPLALKQMKFCFGPAFRIHLPAPIYVDLAFEYAFNQESNVFWFGVRRNL